MYKSWPYFSFADGFFFNLCIRASLFFFSFLFLDFIYLFLDRGEGRERGRETNVWLPLTRPLLGTRPATQACALTGNWTSNPLVYSLCSIHWATPADCRRQRQMCIRDSGCLLRDSYWGPGPQPRHVPWLGIELVTLWFSGRRSIHWATAARAIFCFLYLILNFRYITPM